MQTCHQQSTDTSLNTHEASQLLAASARLETGLRDSAGFPREVPLKLVSAFFLFHLPFFHLMSNDFSASISGPWFFISPNFIGP